jgi:hypothetical protein
VTVWPDPAPEPSDELGENTEGHLLPGTRQLRRLTREELLDLLELVGDWQGPIVRDWRRRARARLDNAT